MKVDYNKDVLQYLVNEIVTSVFSEEGPNEVLKLFDALQPLFMESLFSEGFSVSLLVKTGNIGKSKKEKDPRTHSS